MTIYALTSIAPTTASVASQTLALRSWRKAGLAVRCFQHPSEIPALSATYPDVEFVEVPQTSKQIFGRHYVPIFYMLEWARSFDATALLINSDIEVGMSAFDLQRVARIARDGLCYFVRYNYREGDIRRPFGHRPEGPYARAEREPYGIDGFLLHGRHASLFPTSWLSMGQPWWDYWLPYTMQAAGRPIYSVEFPAVYHRRHPLRWSNTNWLKCAQEFVRMTETLGADNMIEATDLSLRVRQRFDAARVQIPQKIEHIKTWVTRTFRNREPKLFLELGSHRGEDTSWLAAIPGVHVHCFEPDPRNTQPARANVTMHQAAIAEHDGTVQFTQSERGWNQEWTMSGSIHAPTGHLAKYPVTFGDTIEVPAVALDTACRDLGPIDLIWADVQGAEGDMIRGGRETLARTRYLYTEYSDVEMYEGQITLDGILELLPDWRVVELWPDNVLLRNGAI